MSRNYSRDCYRRRAGKHVLRTPPDDDLSSTSALQSSAVVRHRAPSSDIMHHQSVRPPASHLQFFTLLHYLRKQAGIQPNQIVLRYEHEKKTLKALIKAASKISLTTNFWKSSHQKIEYMVIKGHFIDHNWRLQKRVLSFVHVLPPRTGLDIANDGLAMIDSVIGEVREGIKYINNSEARLQTFSNIAHQLQIQDRKLLLDVPTRWNSTYDMLPVALKFKDVFPRFAEYERHFHHLPNDEEWAYVESVCTNVISGSDYPTSNLYLIEVFRVKETFDKGVLSRNDFIRTMVTKMKEKFEKYRGEFHLVMAIASMLDPRFKMKLVEFSFPTIYSNAEKNIEEVKKALYEMYEEYLEIHDASV
ncbi:unnamed protein product [Lactuca virosa]|uniref:hAT-like transposase RNase-H fold domain-containing protein n=1 Tax=Lactuca virosa TaxID=75947 RepID=A0AAU9LN27_9ASTR|nr:unnamed protein product [Lactuca virosa]